MTAVAAAPTTFRGLLAETVTSYKIRCQCNTSNFHVEDPALGAETVAPEKTVDTILESSNHGGIIGGAVSQTIGFVEKV